MPPKKRSEAVARIVVPAVESTSYPGNDNEFFRKSIAAIQSAQQSTANHGAAKKLFLTKLKEDEAEVITALQCLAVGVLKQAPFIAPEAHRRHNMFVRELCKACKDSTASDKVSVSILQALLPYGNAVNKMVRLNVVSSFEELLRTLEPSDVTEERQVFYDEATKLLKLRIYDTCPHVRESAVSAITAFQSGLKQDDVTCNLIAILVEEPSAEVRRQVLKGISCGNGSKEFLHAYFAAMLRATRDQVSKVREAAWDALHRFKWTHITKYCVREKLDVLHHLALGLDDASAPVRTACRITLLKSWLQRDLKDDQIAFLDKIEIYDSSDVNALVNLQLVSAQRVARELLEAHRKAHPQPHLDDDRFKLRLTPKEGERGITLGNVLMWVARCEEMTYRPPQSDVDESDDMVMVPLTVFDEVLKDATMMFAKPDQYTPKILSKTMHLAEVEEVLRLLLESVRFYFDGGFLAHIDNTTRGALVGTLGFLLKVVPDTDPSLFVESCVTAIRLLTPRNAEEAAVVVKSALDLLFSGIRLCREHKLTFEDVEILGRMDAEQRVKYAELKRRYGAQDEAAMKLEEQIGFDQKFLLRMQHIVLAFLSNATRLERVPPFCTFVAQVGRHQCDPEVKVIATRSLSLLCMISPESVHTFFPVLMSDAVASDAQLYVAASEAKVDVTTAALAALFDIVCEYGLKIFGVSDVLPPRIAPHMDESSILDGESFVEESQVLVDIEAQRNRAEELAASESIHRRGAAKVLRQLLRFLTSKSFPQRQVAVVGFCKLLSCNRIPVERIPAILAQLIAHGAVEPSAKKGSSTISQQVSSVIAAFLSSYSASSSLRQGLLAEGGIMALRLLLQKMPTAMVVIQRLMAHIVRLTDASSLKQVRDADPEFAQQAAAEYREDDLADEEGRASSAPDRSTRKQRLNASEHNRLIGHLRLRHELNRCSLHEYIAMELWAEVIADPMSTVAVRVAIAMIPKLRFYCTQASVTKLLLDHCQRAITALPQDEEDAAAKFQAIYDALKVAHEDALREQVHRDAAQDGDVTMERRLLGVEQRLERRREYLEALSSGPAPSANPLAATEDEEHEESNFVASLQTSFLGFSQQAHNVQSVMQVSTQRTSSQAPAAAKPTRATAERRVAQRPAAQAPQVRSRDEAAIEMDDILGRHQRPRK
jgi:condensin complex subunit 3